MAVAWVEGSSYAFSIANEGLTGRGELAMLPKMNVTATRAPDIFGELLERVRSDRVTVTITRYGRPVATLQPIPEADMKQGGESPPAVSPDP